MRIAVVNGPNLNVLGMREPGVYGTTTLPEIEAMMKEAARSLDVDLEFFQSNSEGAIVDYLQSLVGHADALIINPAALTHYSIALRDAVAYLSIPAIEVHLSNIYTREPFRHKSVTAGVVTGQIAGLGWHGYLLALQGVVSLLQLRSED